MPDLRRGALRGTVLYRRELPSREAIQLPADVGDANRRASPSRRQGGRAGERMKAGLVSESGRRIIGW